LHKEGHTATCTHPWILKAHTNFAFYYSSSSISSLEPIYHKFWYRASS